VSWEHYLCAREAQAAVVELVKKHSFPFSGAPAREVSALYMLREVAQFGGMRRMFTATEARIEGGAQALALRLAGRLPAGTVQLQCAVSRVVASAEEVLVEVIQRATTRILRCRHVVCCIPFNVLWRVDFEGLPLDYEAVRAASRVGHAAAPRKVHFTPPPGDADAPGANGAAAECTLLYPGRGQRRCVISDRANSLPAGAASASAASHDWAADPHFGGAWMVPRVGQLAVLEQLRAAQGRVAFAGGDLSAEWPGWMEGAVASALSAAEAVAGLPAGTLPRGEHG
jgi:monoamine oxidase